MQNRKLDLKSIAEENAYLEQRHNHLALVDTLNGIITTTSNLRTEIENHFPKDPVGLEKQLSAVLTLLQQVNKPPQTRGRTP